MRVRAIVKITSIKTIMMSNVYRDHIDYVDISVVLEENRMEHAVFRSHSRFLQAVHVWYL